MFANVTLSLMGGFVTTVQLFCLTLVFCSAARPAYQLRLDEPHYTAARTHQNHRLDRPRHASMLQIIIIYYGPALVWGIKLPRFSAALLSFVINYACYFSEIFRGGIQGIPSGQYEAGQVLGMTKSQIFFKVTLLQVIKRVIPPMGNEFINLVKDTDWRAPSRCTRCCGQAKSSSRTLALSGRCSTPPYSTCCSAAFLTLLFGWIEKKMDYFK